MPINVKNNVFSLISTIILPKVSTLCCLVHLETLAMMYQNPYVATKSIGVSQIYKIMIVMWVNKPVKHSNFITKACRLIILLLFYHLH